MPWDLDSDRPVFIQIVEKIEQDIISGVYQPGEKLPSVRDIALEAAVNPNTMQKAFSELERSGIVYSKRTSGRFVTEDSKLIEKLRKDKANKEIELFLEKMKKMGFNKEDVKKML